MDKLGKWNDISDKLFDEIPQLKPKQVVKFQMLNGAKNNHPESKERDRQPMIYPKANINFKDRIRDPYKGNRGGEMVEIGIWNNLNDKGQPEGFISFMPWAGQHPYTGTFFLIEGRGRDNEIYEYLFLCNDNASNKHRDETRPPLFEIVDVNKEAKGASKRGNALRIALNAAADMTLAEKKEFAILSSWPSDLDEELLDGKLNAYAADYPVEFTKKWGDPERKKKVAIGQASAMNIIKFDRQSGKVSWSENDVLIVRLDVGEKQNWIDVMAESIHKIKNGDKILGNIKQQLKESVPVVEDQE